jgi:ferritin-like metal-binding protein YciE
MFEHINTPEELFSFKLGAALKMENTILDMLGELEEHAQRDDIKQALQLHAQETHQHVANIESAFRMLSQEVDDSPCPAIDGLKAEGKANLKKADDSLADLVILSAAGETEHHEIAVYEALITQAEGLGIAEVVAPLKQNLESERKTLEHVQQSLGQVARAGAAVGG